jgi:hypothetical protein
MFQGTKQRIKEQSKEESTKAVSRNEADNRGTKQTTQEKSKVSRNKVKILKTNSRVSLNREGSHRSECRGQRTERLTRYSSGLKRMVYSS